MIRAIPDFPSPGIVFRHIGPLLADLDAFQDAINELAKTFHDKGLNVYGTPERYVFADSLFYDTYYHLNRQARENRSILVFQDIRTLCGKK